MLLVNHLLKSMLETKSILLAMIHLIVKRGEPLVELLGYALLLQNLLQHQQHLRQTHF